MNKLVLCSIIALLFLQTQAQVNYGVFAFSWYKGHCMSIDKTGGCDPDKLKLWDHQSFTIHGLWPSTTASQTYGDFDVSIIDENEELKDNMNNYWPPQSRATGPETFLWEHEWTKHGPDYAEIILNLQPDRFTGESEEEKNRQLQAAFFNDVVAFYQRFAGAQKYPKNIFSKEEFGRVFGIEADQFTLSCVRANIVREIKVCFNLTPSGAVITRCTSTANTGCKKGNAFELPAWEVSNQDRVIAEPSTLNEEN